MTGIGATFRRFAPLMAACLGDSPEHPGKGQTIELRRPCSLGINEAALPAVSLVLAEDAAAGATALSLQLPGGGADYTLTGSYLAGAGLSLGSDSYRAAEVAAPSGADISVSIDPPLLADAGAGTVVTLSGYVPYTLAGCFVAHRSIQNLQAPQVMTKTTIVIPQTVIEAAAVPGGVQLEDVLVLEDGTGNQVTQRPISAPGFVKVVIGPS